MLNTKEIFLIAALLCFMILMVLFSVKESRIKGVNELLASTALGMAGNILYAFGRDLPPFVSYELANAVYAAASAALLIGYRKLFNQPVFLPVVAVSIAALVGLIAWFHYGVNSFNGRTVAMSMYQVGIAACIGRTVLRSRREWGASRFSAVFVVSMSCVVMVGHSVRALRHIFVASSPDSLLLASGWDVLLLSAGAFVLPVLALGGLLVVHRRIVAMVEHAANRDFLTDAWSRRAFFETSEREMRRAKRTGRPLSILLIDLDNLKVLNDLYGHAAGDEALIWFVHKTENELRAIDCLARIGGDEFAILMPETDSAGALLAAERLIKRVAFVKGEKEKIRISFSVGISLLQHGDTLASMIKRADTALYEAKSSGRNRVVVERPEHHPELQAVCD